MPRPVRCGTRQDRAETPTWVEQGYDAVFSNWRGFVGPKGMTPAQIAYWDGIFAKVVGILKELGLTAG